MGMLWFKAEVVKVVVATLNGDIKFVNHMFQTFAVLSILQLVDPTMTITKIIAPNIICGYMLCVR